MNATQPIIRTRRRTTRVDPSLSRFVNSGSDDRVATRSSRKRAAMAKTGSVMEPNYQSHLTDDNSQAPEPPLPSDGDSARAGLSALDSITSALEESNHANEESNHANEESNHANEESNHANEESNHALVLPSQHLGSTPLAGPTTVEVITARRRRNVATYKQRRSLRLHPTGDENKLSLRSRQITRSISTPTSTPSCSPLPTHVASKHRKRRRRQPPLKHRLARAARSHLPRNESQDAPSQPPVSVPLEYAEENAQPAFAEHALSVEPEDEPVVVPEPNVTQRRLAAPQNYTIPDLKDLLSAKPQPLPAALVDEPAVELQRNPLPQFSRPSNNLHSSRPRMEHKHGRPGRRDMPRLNFVALETHQEQATGRSGEKRLNQVVAVRQVPQAAPIPAANARVLNAPPTPAPAPTPVLAPGLAPAHVNFLTPGQHRSPSRIFVKGTPEPDNHILHIYPDIAEGPSFLRASRPSPLRRTQVPSGLSNPISEPIQTPNHSFAPMSDLLDNLTRLARSAVQMNSKPPTAVPNRTSPKRTHQATLTKDGYLSHLASEIGVPAKVRRLE